MKKINIFLTFLIAFFAFAFVNAKEITSFDMDYYLLPYNGLEMWDMPDASFLRNTSALHKPEVYLSSIEIFDEDGWEMWGSDEFEAGKAYKIVFEFGTNSPNDYMTPNTTLKLKTSEGVKTIKRVLRNENAYTFELNYTVKSAVPTVRTVRFDYDGNDSIELEAKVANNTQIGVASGHYDLDGLAFQGYKANGKTYVPGENYKVTSDVTFVAQYSPVNTYSVKYYVDGVLKKTVASTEGHEIFEYLYPDMTAELGSSVTVSSRWYTDSAMKHLFNTEDMPYITGDLTLYGYSVREYNIYTYSGDYVNNPGYIYIGDVVKEQDSIWGELRTPENQIVLHAVPSAGMKFEGWVDDNEFDYDNWVYVSTNPTYTLTLDDAVNNYVAVFSKLDDANIVIFNNNTNDFYTSYTRSVVVPNGQKVEQVTDMYLFQKELAGWFTDPECIIPYDFNAPVTHDIELYAKWQNSTKTLYPVYFYLIDLMTSDTLDEAYKIVYVEMGKKVTKPETVEKPGKAFIGWYSFNTDEEKFDFNTPIYIRKDLIGVYNDIYTISFDTDGGVALDSITTLDQTNGVLNIPTPQRLGYVFDGWYLDRECTRKYTQSYIFTQDTTLYAKWTEKLPFPDVKKGAWYYDVVKEAYTRGIITGYANGNFGVNDKITRSQIVVILYRLEGIPDVSSLSNPFNDVAAGSWYEDAIKWAYSNHIVNGYATGGFGPNDAIKRKDFAVILYGYAQFKGLDISNTTSLTNFADYKVIKGNYSEPALKWAVANTIVNGSTKNGKKYLNPNNNATRAEAAAMIMNYIHHYGL